MLASKKTAVNARMAVRDIRSLLASTTLNREVERSAVSHAMEREQNERIALPPAKHSRRLVMRPYESFSEWPERASSR